jgi:hypothetical protein
MKKSKLTSDILKTIIAEEKAKLKSLGLIKTVDTPREKLAEAVKYLEKLNLQERALRTQLRKVTELKSKIKKSLLSSRK